ncbi:hypothetical protein [Agromyces sp. NPDC058126]|uniref:hypothetical protein n=1 Tax=Agromyces sp. NPDC058126 TaxID=3346350 RepID=UPI0036DF8A23
MADLDDELPHAIQIDAWPGRPAVGALVAGAEAWGARRGLPPAQEPLAFEKPVDMTCWQDPRVGYGILLRDTPDLAWSREKVSGVLAPPAIRELLAARKGTALLYWNPALGDTHVRRYYDDGSTSDHPVGLTHFGTTKNKLPRYILIAGSPTEIPWQVQFSLAVRHAVGRLPFDGDALEPYIDAMLDGENGWESTPTDDTAPVVWTVDHGVGDITRLMRSVLVAPVLKAFRGTLAGLTERDDAEATASELVAALGGSPTVVITSSHGATPLDAVELPKVLGLPVDVEHSTVPLDDLTSSMPAGAVWFAQACCSAGSSATSRFADLLEPNTDARAVVESVTALGSTVAPAPLALLSRKKPVRAVFGHVEPTFDWTLEDPDSGARLTGDLVDGLSSNLHFGQPVGHIFTEYRAGIGALYSRWTGLAVLLNTDDDAKVLKEMTKLRLTAMDRQSLVLLGDPTVRIPGLG